MGRQVQFAQRTGGLPPFHLRVQIAGHQTPRYDARRGNYRLDHRHEWSAPAVAITVLFFPVMTQISLRWLSNLQ